MNQQVPSHQANPIKVFVSYVSASERASDQVSQLAKSLRAHEIYTVNDQEPMPHGTDLEEYARQEIDSSDFVVIVCGQAYRRLLDQSSWPVLQPRLGSGWEVPLI